MERSREKSSKNKIVKRAVIAVILIGLICASSAFGISFYIQRAADDRIFAADSAWSDFGADCILVLGCGVRDDGSPSPMLRDRMTTAVELYKSGAAPKLLVSGDHGRTGYDEVNVMRDFALKAGVPSEDIFMDHAGFSTYDSVYRAGEVFQVEKAVIVTQRYHLYRALYGCERMGTDSLGAAADQAVYRGQNYREFREVLARDKDLAKWIVKPDPTFLGDTIPISGTGIESH